MKIRIFLLSIYLTISLLPNGLANCDKTICLEDTVLSKITQYSLSIPACFDQFTMGFQSGVGSSLHFKQINADGSLEFYTLCDRGPNYTLSCSQAQDVLIFPKPQFSPFIGTVTLVPGSSATLTQVTLLKMDGRPISGLPIMEMGDDLPLPADACFNKLCPDPSGLDTESLSVDHEGNFWVGDEYYPALIKANAQGDIIEKWTPRNGLPEILKHRLMNRGFEALSVTPSGKILISMESILDLCDDYKNSNNLIRMVLFDPKTKQSKTFAYPYDKEEYRSPVTAKIGDMAAIDDTRFLIVEQGKTCTGMRNVLYIIDINKATDISDLKLKDGNALEYGTLGELSPIQFIKKYKIFDAVDYGWTHEKLEGVAIINPKTIAITNDNDFGLWMSINGVSTEKVEDYSYDFANRQLLHCKKATPNKVDIHINSNATTQIWVIELQKSLLDFIPK